MTRLMLSLISICFAVAAACPAGEDTLFVDPQLPVATTTTYNPATRKADGGAVRAFKQLKDAADAATAGQNVILRGGTYAEQLAPKNSGTASALITFKNQKGEEAIISGKDLSPAIVLDNRSYIAIEGLKIVQVRRWLIACKAQHCILKGNTFAQALDEGGSSKTGLFFEEAHFNRIVDNTLADSTQDHLALIKSDHNLVEGNIFTKAKHVLWTIKGGNYNVIRRNYLHNSLEKIGEVFDCERVGSSHQFNDVNCTKHNLIEWNVFAHTANSGDHSPFAGIQYAGQDGIIRNNIFYDNIGPALDLSLYPEEARYNTGNRVCHNVFYKNHYCGIAIAGKQSGKFTFENNEFKNNALLKNVFVRNDTRWDWFKELHGKPVQIFAGSAQGFVFDHNVIYNAAPGEKYLVTMGARDANTNPAPENLSWWTANQGNVMKFPLEIDPQFVDADKRDFRLKADSPAIDVGAFLTRAAADGAGNVLTVQDARWFCDGFGIDGLGGDEIQLDGQSLTVRVVKIDYEKNILTLSAKLKWSAGQGVSLKFNGKAPDMGAFEFGPGKQPLLAPAPPPGIEK